MRLTDGTILERDISAWLGRHGARQGYSALKDADVFATVSVQHGNVTWAIKGKKWPLEFSSHEIIDGYRFGVPVPDSGPPPTRGRHMPAARRLMKPQCERCGSPNRLQAHHINRNWTDNRPENVQTLCHTCHHIDHARDFFHDSHVRFPRLSNERLAEAARYWIDKFITLGRRHLRNGNPWPGRSAKYQAQVATRKSFAIDLLDHSRFDDFLAEVLDQLGLPASFLSFNTQKGSAEGFERLLASSNWRPRLTARKI